MQAEAPPVAAARPERVVDVEQVVVAAADPLQLQPQRSIPLRTRFSPVVVTAFTRLSRVRLMTPYGALQKRSRGISFE